jgi:hypothetical protein
MERKTNPIHFLFDDSQTFAVCCQAKHNIAVVGSQLSEEQGLFIKAIDNDRKVICNADLITSSIYLYAMIYSLVPLKSSKTGQTQFKVEQD